MCSQISFKSDWKKWVVSMNKNQINLKVAPSNNAILNINMWTNTEVNSLNNDCKLLAFLDN